MQRFNAENTFAYEELNWKLSYIISKSELLMVLTPKQHKLPRLRSYNFRTKISTKKAYHVAYIRSKQCAMANNLSKVMKRKIVLLQFSDAWVSFDLIIRPCKLDERNLEGKECVCACPAQSGGCSAFGRIRGYPPKLILTVNLRTLLFSFALDYDRTI